MRNFTKLSLVTGLCAISLCLVACEPKPAEEATTVSAPVTAGSLHLSDYAMRAALGNNTATSAYVTIKNTGDTPDQLVSVACSCAQSADLHTMFMKGDTMEMAEAKEGFPIPAGQTLVLAPGGKHIMLQGILTRPGEGETVRLTLKFAHAGTVDIDMPVSNAPLIKTGDSGEHAGMKM